MAYANFQEVKRKKPVRWWHEAIIDDMLAFPLDTLKARGARLNYDPAYLNVIINSDMFKAVYHARRGQYAERLDASLVQKTAEVAGAALDLMLESMQKKRTAIPFPALMEAADKTLSRLGYGVKGQPQTGVSVNVNGAGAQVAVVAPVSPEQLAEARLALRNAEQQRALAAPLRPVEQVPSASVEVLPPLPDLEES